MLCLTALEHAVEKLRNAKKLPLIAEVRKEVQLDEDVQLPCIHARISVQRGQQVNEMVVRVAVERTHLICEFCAHVLDRVESLGNDVLVLCEIVVTVGKSPLGECDFDTEFLGQFCAILNIVIVGGVIQKRGDIFQRIVMPVIGAEITKKAVGDGMIITELIAGAVFDNLQELFCLLFRLFPRLRRLSAVPSEDTGKRRVQSILLLTANSAAYVIRLTACQATYLLEELNGVLLIDQVPDIGFQHLINDFGRIVVWLSRQQVVSVRCA